MEEPSLSEADERNLRFLRILVLVLTATMIVGMVVLVILFLTRFPATPGDDTAPVAVQGQFVLPDQLQLPDGAEIHAVTQGNGWWAVVTSAEILIFDAETGELRQSVAVDSPSD